MSNVSYKTLERYHELTALTAAKPDDAGVWLEFARSRAFRNETEEALAAFRKVVSLTPGQAESLLELGMHLATLSSYNRIPGKKLDYNAFYREALEVLSPLMGDREVGGMALIGFGRAKLRLGEVDAAIDCFFQVARCFPTLAGKIWDGEFLIIPRNYPRIQELIDLTLRCGVDPILEVNLTLGAGIVELAAGDIDKERERVEQTLKKVKVEKPQLPFSTGLNHAYRQVGIDPYTCEIMPLRRNLAEYFSAACPELNFVSPNVAKRLSMSRPRRLRLGFLLHRSWDADFGSMLAKLFASIDKDRFEIILFYNDKTVSENIYARKVRELADEIILFPLADWPGYCEAVSTAALDMLIHENAMLATTFTGFARLAPVQCSFIDTGSPLVAPCEDYYLGYGADTHFPGISAKAAIPAVAYFKEMIMLADPERAVLMDVRLSDFDIPEEARVFLAFEGIDRWREKDEHVIGELLRRYPDAWFLGRHNDWAISTLTEKRWRERTLTDVYERIRFFHFLPLSVLMGLLRRANLVCMACVSSGTISTQLPLGMSIPTPLFANSMDHHALSVVHYEYMELPELIARDHGEYVRIQCRLLDDPDWRATMARRVGEGMRQILDDRTVVAEFQDFLEGAYQRARQGLPPVHWHNGGFVG